MGSIVHSARIYQLRKNMINRAGDGRQHLSNGHSFARLEGAAEAPFHTTGSFVLGSRGSYVEACRGASYALQIKHFNIHARTIDNMAGINIYGKTIRRQ